MLLELQAANAAFAIIKKTIANGQDLIKAGQAISDFVNAEETLRQKHSRKRNSFWLRVGGKDASDLEEFMALNELEEKRKAIESAMMLYGRPGLYHDWVKFQAEARKARKAAKEARAKRRQNIINIILITATWVIGGIFAALLLSILFAVYARAFT